MQVLGEEVPRLFILAGFGGWGSRRVGRFLLEGLGSRRLNAWIATLAGMMAMLLGDERRLFLATRLDRGCELPPRRRFPTSFLKLDRVVLVYASTDYLREGLFVDSLRMHTDNQNRLKHRQGAAVRYDHDCHSTPLSKCARRHRRLDRATSARSVHDPSGTPPAERSNSDRIER